MPGILLKALSVSMFVGFPQLSLADGLALVQGAAFLASTSIPEEKQKTFLTTSYYQILVKDNNIIKSTQKPAGDAGLVSWHSMTQKENERGRGCADISDYNRTQNNFSRASHFTYCCEQLQHTDTLRPTQGPHSRNGFRNLKASLSWCVNSRPLESMLCCEDGAQLRGLMGSSDSSLLDYHSLQDNV